MKQLVQDLRGGRTIVEDVPAPLCAPGNLRIATRVSLISAGTERMLLDFSRGSLISKARQQPEKVAQTIQKVRTEGLASTIEAVRSKLDQPIALGYCNVGQVIEVGAGVEGFAVGDRVLSNGKHAEIVVSPKNLCAKIPDGVDDESAAFAVLGAIALQGIRLAQPTLGESFVVTGLGIVGLLTVQLLRASGCRVLGIDANSQRVALARGMGAEGVDISKGEDPVAGALAFSRGRGVDGVLLTLSTSSSEPVSQAARMCRKRGRVVLVGVTGLQINRSDFYEKEITFQVSCSYGPGRYDPLYEDKGQDYPVGFVRWTEQRNFEAVLDMMASGALDIRSLITHRFGTEEAGRAYNVLGGAEPSMGILLEFRPPAAVEPIGHDLRTRIQLESRAPLDRAQPRVALLGVGNYGGRVLAKAFKDADANLQVVISAGGVSAVHHGRKWGFQEASSDSAAAFGPDVDAVCIATRHDSHASYVLRALEAGKNVFVEKPLCLTRDELQSIQDAAGRPGAPLLTVGFNRRFAPMVQRMSRLLAGFSEPKALTMTVNAGHIPPEVWVQDPQVGGGRIVGEACHFIDLLRFLVGAPVIGFDVVGLDRPGGPALSDVVSIRLSFEDGSFGVINYLANGHKSVAKERLEVFCAGRVLQLDNYLKLAAHGWPKTNGMRSFGQDKGQGACVAAFVQAVKAGGATAPIPLDELLEVSRLSIEIAQAAAA